MQVIHHYRLEENLCENDLVQVFRASEKNADKSLTLSLVNTAYEINPKILMRMIAEGGKSGLTHPHIAKIIDFGEIDQQQYFVSDYIGCKTLSSFLGKPVPVTFALDVISQLASGIHFLSIHGYIHGNIHPDNIFFDSYGNAILSALELVPKQSKNIAGADGEDGVENTNAKPSCFSRYHSPEFIENAVADDISDLYGLGVLLFEMLTGEYFDDRKYLENAGADNINELIPYLPEDNFGFQPVINKLLAKNPKQRYQNGLQLVDALDEYDSRLVGVDEVDFPLEFDDDSQPVPQFEKIVEEMAEEILVEKVAETALATTLATDNAVSIESAERAESVENELGPKQLTIPEIDAESAYHADNKGLKVVKLGPLTIPILNFRFEENRKYVGAGSVFVLLMLGLLFFLPENKENINVTVAGSFTAPLTSGDNMAGPATATSTLMVMPTKSSTSSDFSGSAALRLDEALSEVNNEENITRRDFNSNEMALQDEAPLLIASMVGLPPLITELDVENASVLAAELSEKIDVLLLRAQDYINRLKYTAPKDKNAYAVYLSVLAMDPDNITAKEGITSIAETYAHLAKRQISEHHYEKAKRYITKGLLLEKDNEWLIALQTEVTQWLNIAAAHQSLGARGPTVKSIAFDSDFE